MKNRVVMIIAVLAVLLVVGGCFKKPDKNTLDLNKVKNGFAGFVDGVSAREITVGESITFFGWAVDLKGPAPEVIVVDGDDKIVGRCKPNIDYPDVATYLKRPETVKSGWKISISGSKLGRGKHFLFFYGSSYNQKYRLLNFNDALKIKGQSVQVQVN